MPQHYSRDQRACMVELFFDEANRNAHRVSELFTARYPGRRPSHNTVLGAVRDFQMYGNVNPRFRGEGRQNINMEDMVIAYFIAYPRASVRRASDDLGLSANYVWTTLHNHAFHPYRATLHQPLHEGDMERRFDYCNWLITMSDENQNIIHQMLVTDECSFGRDGPFNHQNRHMWCDVNPHWSFPHHHQQQLRLNVWAGLLGDRVIGPFFIPDRLNGQRYLALLQNEIADALEDIPLAAYRHLWYQHDGAPPHIPRCVVEHLNNEFPQRWIGRNGYVPWPARSPDLTPMDFFLWGFIKEHVYATPVANVADLRHRIINAFQLVTPDMIRHSFQNMLYRAQMCIAANGDIIEHHL